MTSKSIGKDLAAKHIAEARAVLGGVTPSPSEQEVQDHTALVVKDLRSVAKYLDGGFEKACVQAADIIERLSAENARLSQSPWITDEGFKDAADVLENARIGRSFMERLDAVRRTPGWGHWAPADDPTEIVTDLLNKLADEEHDAGNREGELKLAEQELSSLRAAVESKDAALRPFSEHYAANPGAPDEQWVDAGLTFADFRRARTALNHGASDRG